MLPEKLRAVGDYRMLIYAVLLIAVMLLTQSQKGKDLFAKIAAPVKEFFECKADKERKGGAHND